MKPLLIFLFCCLFPSFESANANREYYYQIEDIPGYDCNMVMYNGKYQMTMENTIQDDYHQVIVLLQGHYVCKGDEYVLTDMFDGSTMQLCRTSTQGFFVQKSFPFLEGRTFQQTDEIIEWWPWYDEDCNGFRQKVKKLMNKKSRKHYKLHSGTYRCSRPNFKLDYSLELLENETYNWYFHEHKVSSGIYQRDRNILTLIDEHLQATYRVRIEKDYISSSYLPLCPRDIQLYFQKTIRPIPPHKSGRDISFNY